MGPRKIRLGGFDKGVGLIGVVVCWNLKGLGFNGVWGLIKSLIYHA